MVLQNPHMSMRVTGHTHARLLAVSLTESVYTRAEPVTVWRVNLCVALQLMQHYEVQLRDGAPAVEPKTRTLLIPAKPIDLRFLARA